MPRGPRGEKRPADVIGNAIKVARIATGEEEEELVDKSQTAVKAGRLGGQKGGKSRASKLSPSQRTAIARKAAAMRWQRKSQ